MNKYIVIVGMTTLLVISACKQRFEDMDTTLEAKNRVTPVKMQEVDMRYEAIPIRVIGRLAPNQEVKLSFKIGGIIARITVDEGSYVNKGDLIAELRQDEIAAQVLKASRALEKAQRDLDRVKKMYDEGAATLENVQDLTTLVEVSQADLNIANFNKSFSQIRAEVNGRVLRRLAEPNETVGPGQPILVVAADQLTAHQMRVSVSDKEVAQLSIGNDAKLEFDAFPGQVFQGRIIQIAETANPLTATFDVEISVRAGSSRLRNGFIGRAEIQPALKDSFYIIPMSAIVEADEGDIVVFSPDDAQQSVIRHVVTPKIIGENEVAVEARGIRLSRVITDGSAYLVDGDKIQVVH